MKEKTSGSAETLYTMNHVANSLRTVKKTVNNSASSQTLMCNAIITNIYSYLYLKDKGFDNMNNIINIKSTLTNGMQLSL